MWLPGPGPLHAKQGTAQIRTLSNSLVKFKEYIPQEFARKCRPLTHLERWKATEFRTFLLYTDVVALLGKFPEIIYGNFMMLHVAITIFSNNLLLQQQQFFSTAKDCLTNFVAHCSALYGQQILTYNFHALTHLADDVVRFGNLNEFSAFPFENYLHAIKRLIWKPKCTLQQLIRRIEEKKMVKPKVQKRKPHLCQGHENGPLPRNFPP